MLRCAILLLVSTIGFCVALLAATKASVEGHLFWYVRLTYFMTLGIAPSFVWLFWKSGRNPTTLHLSKLLYLSSFTGILLTLPALQAVNQLIDPSLVSNRSYGVAIGSVVYLLFGYALWYFSVYRPHNKRFKSFATLTRDGLKPAP